MWEKENSCNSFIAMDYVNETIMFLNQDVQFTEVELTLNTSCIHITSAGFFIMDVSLLTYVKG